MHRDQFILAGFVNINHHEIYTLHKKRYRIGYIYGFCESNYDI